MARQNTHGFYGTTPVRSVVSSNVTEYVGNEFEDTSTVQSLLMQQQQLISSLIKENQSLQTEVSSFSTQLKEVKENMSCLKGYVEDRTRPEQEKKLPKPLTVS